MVERRRRTVRLVVRLVAVLAALSVAGTLWFVAAIAAADGIGVLLSSGLLGVLTIIGWVLTLIVGPVAAVQLWRFRESGRLTGVIVFGYGLAYYVVGFFALRTPEASVGQIAGAAIMCAVPLIVLLSPRTRAIFAANRNTG